MKYTCMKLQHKDDCVLEGITKKPIYFPFDTIYLTHTWTKYYSIENKLEKLLTFRKIYLEPTFTMWNFKINA
jgi:hypothetical protein